MITLFNLLSLALEIYSFAIIVYIFMSWFPGARESSFGVLLAKIAEPFLEPFRKIIPPIGMMDLSPIVAIFALYLARSAGLPVLYNMLSNWF